MIINDKSEIAFTYFKTLLQIPGITMENHEKGQGSQPRGKNLNTELCKLSRSANYDAATLSKM
jgi:hypothetical protein